MEISSEKSKKDFYVYALLDPRREGVFEFNVPYGEKFVFTHEPFYVGKGRGKRSSVHAVVARSGKNNSYKDNKIRTIFGIGLEVLVEHVVVDLTEEDALQVESELIEVIGRLVDKSGILTNLTSGGGGISGYSHTSEARRRISKRFIGKPLSEEHRKKIGDANRGKERPAEVKEKIRAKLIGRKHPKFVPRKRGATRSEETKERMREAAKNRPKIQCPHCGMQGQTSQMKRWHFENCKQKSEKS